MKITTASCLTVTVAIAAVFASAAPAAKQQPLSVLEKRNAESWQEHLEDSIEHHVNSAQHYAHKAQATYAPAVSSHINSAQGYLNTEVNSAQKHHLARSAAPAAVEHRLSVEDRKVHDKHTATAAPASASGAKHAKSKEQANGDKDVPGRKNGNLLFYGFHEAHSGTREAGDDIKSVDKMIYGSFDRRHHIHETAPCTASAGASALAQASASPVVIKSHDGTAYAPIAHASATAVAYAAGHQARDHDDENDDSNDAQRLAENGYDYGALVGSSGRSQATSVVDAIDSTLYGFAIADPTAAFPASSQKKARAKATASASMGKNKKAAATGVAATEMHH